MALAGLGVAAGTYAVAALTAHSCNNASLATLGSCIGNAAATLVLCTIVLTGLAMTVLWRLSRSPAGPAVAVLAMVTEFLLTWRLFVANTDLEAALGVQMDWVLPLALPAFYVGWLLLLTRGSGRRTGLTEVAGTLLLVAWFVPPTLVSGAELRRFQADERAAYQALSFALYLPAVLPPGDTLTGAEGPLYSTPPQVQLEYGPAPDRSFELVKSAPCPGFSPPRMCGSGAPHSYLSSGDTSCQQVATTPSGESIYFRINRASASSSYAVQRGQTVITATSWWLGGGQEALEPSIVRVLQSLRPVSALHVKATVDALNRG